MYKVLGKVIEAAKEEDKKVLLVRQNKAKILKVFIGQHSSWKWFQHAFRIKRIPLPVVLSLLDQPHPAEIYVLTFVHNDIMYLPALFQLILSGEKSKLSTACARSAAIWSHEKNCDWFEFLRFHRLLKRTGVI